MSALSPAGPATTHRVRAAGGSLHVTDQPGAEPAVVLLHGFPDDSRIYDRLIPHLAPHRAVAFGLLGYGHSDRADGRPDPRQHEAELAAVLDSLGIDRRSWRATTPAGLSPSTSPWTTPTASAGLSS
jgi:haloalkane dehalogenase